MLYLLAVVLIVIGAILALIGVGVAGDPEGRGGKIIYLFFVGVVVVIAAVSWLLWMIWTDLLRGNPFFSI